MTASKRFRIHIEWHVMLQLHLPPSGYAAYPLQDLCANAVPNGQSKQRESCGA